MSLMFEAGLMADAYPLRRQNDPLSPGALHSRPFRGRARRRLYRQYVSDLEGLKNPSSQTQPLAGRVQAQAPEPLSRARIALSFARFAMAWFEVHGQYPDRLHIESAYALLHRRIEQLPSRPDRLMIAGLASSALAQSGVRAHIVLESDHAIPYLNSMLAPVFRKLQLSVGVVDLETPESQRRQAYACAITIVSARECAMDFLRDAVNWPQRADAVSRKVDQLLGGRSKQASNLMHGLPCAVLLDADSTLIDNARTPIALTRDANPMYETEVLKQALEMVGYLQRGQHYELTGEAAEVELSDLGHRQLAAWTEQLQGVWKIESIAQRLLCGAIVADSLIRAETHYRIHSKAVEWIVDERLVPGMAYYSKALISRLVALQQGLELNEQREVAARASYQQIFNRYVHLCGSCHSLELIEPELRKVYGLKCSRRWPTVALTDFHLSSLSRDTEQKIERLASILADREPASVSIILAYDPKLLLSLQGMLQETIPDIQLLDPTCFSQPSACFKAGTVWLAQNQLFEHLAPMLTISAQTTLITLQRSARYSEDARHLLWMQAPPFDRARRVQLLALDDELFAESVTKRLQNMVGFCGSGWRAGRLERRIAQIQRNKAQALVAVRRQLLSHDTTMQGLLSFSGRGLYE